jgi:hypothetical protein
VDDYFDKNDANNQALLVVQMSNDLSDMFNQEVIIPAITGNNQNGDTYETDRLPTTKPLLKRCCDSFIESLEHIMRDNEGIRELLVRSYNDQKENSEKLVVEEGCYVATCVYGSYDCPEVWTLRRFRDDTLGATWCGRAFIRTYYAVSPTLVKWFGDTNWFKKMWKGKLDRMVAKLQSNGVENTPYEDKNW